jgi:hypothetical protein
MRDMGLYRGKRVDGDGWIEGSLCRAGDRRFIVYDDDFYMHTDCCGDHLISDRFFEVDPATVGEFTGLCDGKDAKIWEDSTCEFTVFDYNGSDTQHTGVVKFNDGEWQIWATADNPFYGSDGPFTLYWVLNQDDEFKVTGSIHDAKEG